MPRNARIVSVAVRNGQAHAAFRVLGDGPPGPGGEVTDTEYNVAVPLEDEQGQRKPLPRLRAELVSAAAALRRSQLPPDHDGSLDALLNQDVSLD